MKTNRFNANRLHADLMLALLGLSALTSQLQAASHGPAFGLATPTLGKGQWSSDTVGMALDTTEGASYMTREWVGYGITPDLQATLAFPLSPTVDELATPPRTRFGSMMGAFGDVEGSLLWRFQRHATGIGARYESTMMLSGSLPTEDRRGAVGVGPSVNVAAVTGYASRSLYGWVGGGFQRYFERHGGRLGDLPYFSAVFGWRPPIFRHDFPKPDWRIFVESLSEFPQRDHLAGAGAPGQRLSGLRRGGATAPAVYQEDPGPWIHLGGNPPYPAVAKPGPTGLRFGDTHGGGHPRGNGTKTS